MSRVAGGGGGTGGGRGRYVWLVERGRYSRWSEGKGGKDSERLLVWGSTPGRITCMQEAGVLQDMHEGKETETG